MCITFNELPEYWQSATIANIKVPETSTNDFITVGCRIRSDLLLLESIAILYIFTLTHKCQDAKICYLHQKCIIIP